MLMVSVRTLTFCVRDSYLHYSLLLTIVLLVDSRIGSVTFNWLGVAARVRVNGSQKEGGWSYVTANVTTDAEHRG